MHKTLCIIGGTIEQFRQALKWAEKHGYTRIAIIQNSSGWSQRIVVAKEIGFEYVTSPVWADTYEEQVETYAINGTDILFIRVNWDVPYHHFWTDGIVTIEKNKQ